MDAELSHRLQLPRREAVRLELRSIVEPLSGLSLLRLSAEWDQVATEPRHPISLELRYDGECVGRATVALVESAEIPPGHVRLGAGLQVPQEADTRAFEAALVSPEGEIVLPLRINAEAAPSPAGLLQRTLRAMLRGEAFSRTRWQARIHCWFDSAARLRQRLADRLLARRFAGRGTYDAYVANTAFTPRMRSAMEDELRRFRRRPTFSILMPVYNVDPRWLKKAIDSVLGQVYPHWELCLADDASTRPDLLYYLNHLPKDPRIKIVRRPVNGHICAAANSAADLATGEFVAFLDNDDLLTPDALFALADALRHRPDADLLYSDEDKIDSAEHRYDPQFKPDWSPELLLSYNYINHFTAVRRSLFDSVGRLRLGFEGAQDHDLLLRITERTERVVHVPRVLYHWRSLPTSTASAAGVKGYVHTSSERAVAEALERRGSNASLYPPPIATRLNLPIQQLDGPDSGPSVAVLVYGHPGAARRTLQALRKTSYSNFTDYLVLDGDSPAEALNQVAAARDEDFLLVLEAGVEPTDPRWLSRLMAYARLDGVGLATARIIDHDGTVVSAGTVLGMRDALAPAEAFAGLTASAVSYYFLAESARNLSAARGTCFLVRRRHFDRLGGFDARRYPATLWDVDFSLRLHGLGLRIAYVPGAELRRSELTTTPDRPTELLALKQAWGRQDDPCHNPNLSAREPFHLTCDSPLSLPAEARTPRVRLLAVSPTFNAAEGAPRCLRDIVRGLRNRGSVASSIWSPLGGPAAADLQNEGVPILIEPGPAPRRFVDGQWSRREYAEFQRFAESLLRLKNPEVVLANTLLAFPIVEAAANLGMPVVWVLHESYSPVQLRSLFPEFTCRRLAMAFRLASRVVAVSHDSAARYESLLVRGNGSVIHNGLEHTAFDDTAEIMETPHGKKVLLAVGTVCERKGQHTLVEAAARLAQSRSDFVCYLVGMREGIPYAEYVRHLVRRRKVEHLVRLVPETGDVRPYYRAADLFVNCSHLEAYSLSILEAEAFGLPIVSTACPGVNEQVVWGANALRFTPNDADGLAAVLGPVLDDAARRREMGRESRAMFELHLSESEMLDRYETLILAAARTGPRGLRRCEPLVDPLAIRRAA